MDSGKLAIYRVMGIIYLIQCIYLGIKRRREKNFYHEPKLLNFFSAGAGLAVLLYDFIGIWELGTNSDEKLAVKLLGILLLLVIFAFYRNFSTGKKYTVHNISKADLETILFQTLEKYGLEYRKKEESPHAMDTEIFLDQYDASVRMNQRAGNGKNFELVFIRFGSVYYFEEIVLDMKERVNESTKASRLRGISEFAAAIAILAFAAWLGVFKQNL